MNAILLSHPLLEWDYGTGMKTYPLRSALQYQGQCLSTTTASSQENVPFAVAVLAEYIRAAFQWLGH